VFNSDSVIHADPIYSNKIKELYLRMCNTIEQYCINKILKLQDVVAVMPNIDAVQKGDNYF